MGSIKRSGCRIHKQRKSYPIIDALEAGQHNGFGKHLDRLISWAIGTKAQGIKRQELVAELHRHVIEKVLPKLEKKRTNAEKFYFLRQGIRWAIRDILRKMKVREQSEAELRALEKRAVKEGITLERALGVSNVERIAGARHFLNTFLNAAVSYFMLPGKEKERETFDGVIAIRLKHKQATQIAKEWGVTNSRVNQRMKQFPKIVARILEHGETLKRGKRKVMQG